MTEITDKNKKDDTYWKVLNCALELEFKKGHLKWTMTELSRKSKITRSLIYYYFGRSKMDILEAAVNIIGTEFIGLTKKREEMWKNGDYEAGLMETRKLSDKMPFLCAFFLNYRDRPNEIGQALRKTEENLLKKLKLAAPNANQAQLNTLYAVYFGMTYSPKIGPEEIKIFAGIVRNTFGKLK